MEEMRGPRDNMVDCQISTMGVVSGPVLEAYSSVPREKFVPEDKQSIAYTDEDLKIAPGRWLVEPLVHARMLQALEPKSGDVALDIGDTTGYSSAILSMLVSTVVCVDSNETALNEAQQRWEVMTHCNIVGHCAPLEQGCAQHAPYDLIVLNGAVGQIPKELLSQLANGGRLVAVVRQNEQEMGKVTIVECVRDGVFSERILFDAATPYLPGFEPHKEFVF